MGRGGAAGSVALALALSLAPAPPARGGGEADPDADVRRRIEDLRARAARIRVDGRGGDWRGFPSFDDEDPRPLASASMDIVRVAVAPREEDLLVLVETAGPPSRAPLAFGVDIDFLGASQRDAGLRFGAVGPVRLRTVPEGGGNRDAELERVEVAVGQVVELRVPLGRVAAALGTDLAKAWLEGVRRPFVRVWVFTGAGGPAEPFDRGPAAASFRLAPPPFALDPPVAAGEEPRRALRPPFAGKWFVRQGAGGLWSHRDLRAYDLAVEDGSLQPSRVPGSRRLEDYLSWDRPVLAPEAGTVVFDSEPAADNPPLEAGDGRSTGNTLVLRFDDGWRLLLGHLRRGSAAFPRGGAFGADAEVARVGNSGNSTAPHLHLSLHEKPGEFVGLPLAFRDVRVSLNPGPDDPWARDLPEWAVREGWFVERR